MPTIKDLHCGMGEFLTASSEVENVMLAFVTTRRQRDRARDEVFVDFMGKTLGQKIDEFKRVCNAYEFTKGQRAILDEVYAELDTLLPKRNFIVHGTTYQIGKNSDSVQPYRIGMTRGDFDHMNQFIAQDFDGPHAFTVERIAVVTTKCVALRENLQSWCSKSSDHFKPGNNPSTVENFPRRVVIAGAEAALRCRHEQARANPVAPRSARA